MDTQPGPQVRQTNRQKAGGMVLLADQVTEVVLQALVLPDLAVTRVAMGRLGRLAPMRLVVIRVATGLLGRLVPVGTPQRLPRRRCQRFLRHLGTLTTVRTPQKGRPARGPEG
jgi:hypothetical protein